MVINKLIVNMKREVEGSSPLSVTLLLSLTPLHRVLSLVCPELTSASPRSPCLPTLFTLLYHFHLPDFLQPACFSACLLFVLPLLFCGRTGELD